MYRIPKLPLHVDFESKELYRKLIESHRALAELKGVTESLPDQSLLFRTLSLQEAKDSSAIENIITTHDELYRSDQAAKRFVSQAAKEVYRYAEALQHGYRLVKKHAIITNRHILEIQATIEENETGFRTLPGTMLKNEQTGETVYTPPQGAEEISALMGNLEEYINSDSLGATDPLIKMAIIHHQFESIHPFYDGNGRTGRILNVLYLVKMGLLDTPVLYLSRYINENRGEYYRRLQYVRDHEGEWEEWVLFMLDALLETSKKTIGLIQAIRTLMQQHKEKIRRDRPRIYSQTLLKNLFRHPYTKVEYLAQEVDVHRNTARKYLEDLTDLGVLEKSRVGRENLYINIDLYNLLFKAGG